MVAPSLWAATVFSTAGGRSERLIFFSWADEIPASSNPLAANATNRFAFMFPPERWRFVLSLRQSYALDSKQKMNRNRPSLRANDLGRACALAPNHLE